MPGIQVADVAGGSWPAVAGILAALLGREARGEGAHVDVSMTEGALAMLALPLAIAQVRGTPLARGAEVLTGGAACYSVYGTRDGRFVALGALEPKFFAAFCEAVGRPDLAPRQLEDGGAGPHADLAAIFVSRTRDEWASFAAEHDVCVAPLLEGDEPREDPHLRARGAFVDVPTGSGGALPVVAGPIRMRGETAPVRPAPRLGEHTDEVLAQAGVGPDEIASLRALGIIAA